MERECLRDNHFWDFNSCECICDLEHKCGVNADNIQTVWDRKSCSCVCPPPATDWPTGRTWNCKTCEFDCIISPDTCGDGETWDQDSCACICTPTACPAGQEFVDCNCVCTYEDCARGFYFDTVTCKCLCEPHACPTDYYFNTEVCAC